MIALLFGVKYTFQWTKKVRLWCVPSKLSIQRAYCPPKTSAVVSKFGRPKSNGLCSASNFVHQKYVQLNTDIHMLIYAYCHFDWNRLLLRQTHVFFRKTNKTNISPTDQHPTPSLLSELATSFFTRATAVQQALRDLSVLVAVKKP